MFAGLLRLDLNEEPLKEWVTRTVEASGITQEEVDADGMVSNGEEAPQQIEIEWGLRLISYRDCELVLQWLSFTICNDKDSFAFVYVTLCSICKRETEIRRKMFTRKSPTLHLDILR